MTLDEYLTKTGQTEAQFSLLVGVKQSTINKWRRQQRLPRAQILAKIAKVTNGDVTANDLVNAFEF